MSGGCPLDPYNQMTPHRPLPNQSYALGIHICTLLHTLHNALNIIRSTKHSAHHHKCNAQCTAQSVTITYDPIRAIFIRSCNGGRRSPTVAFREQLLHFITFSFCHIESPRHITSCCTILSCVASNNLLH